MGDGTLLQLSPHETFHLQRVLRLKVGRACEVFNQKGWGAEAVIEAIPETGGAKLRVRKVFPLKQRGLFLKVAQALPQKGKLDDLVKRAEELGVQEFWVLETARNIVRMRGEARERARKRWERIAIEAAKQSGSPVLMRMEGPLSFQKVVQEKLESSDQSFLFHPDPHGLPFSELIEELKRSQTKPASAPLFLFFGPEGGFTEEEVCLAGSRGVRKVFLGDSTLRLETAFLGVVSALRLLMP